MLRLFAAAVALVVGSFAAADEKKSTEPSGTWTHAAGAYEVHMAFGKETLVITVLSGDNGAVITSSYTVDAGGKVSLKVTKVEEKGTFPDKPPVGMTASFVWKADGKKATLAGLAGEGTGEAKNVLEGEYVIKK